MTHGLYYTRQVAICYCLLIAMLKLSRTGPAEALRAGFCVSGLVLHQGGGREPPLTRGMRTHSRTHPHAHTHSRMRTHTLALTHMYTHSHSHAHTYTHSHAHAYTLTRTHSCTHIHSHSHTRTLTHMHTLTHACAHLRLLPSPRHSGPRVHRTPWSERPSREEPRAAGRSPHRAPASRILHAHTGWGRP